VTGVEEERKRSLSNTNSSSGGADEEVQQLQEKLRFFGRSCRLENSSFEK
jgi:hypothetical protein